RTLASTLARWRTTTIRIPPRRRLRESFLFIARRPHRDKARPDAPFSRMKMWRMLRRAPAHFAFETAWLVHFHDARRLHHRRFLLALGKPGRAFAVDIDAGKLLAIMVINSNLPVPVLSPAVAMHPICSLGSLLFHLAVP